MTRSEAWTKIRALLGKDATIQIGKTISSPEKRAAAMEQWRAKKAARDAITVKLDARRKELLQDPEYQRLLAEWKTADQMPIDSLGYHKFQAGTANSLFFHVMASGDTWEEVIAQLETRAGKRKAS